MFHRLPVIAEGDFLIRAASIHSSLLAAAMALTLAPAVAQAQDVAPPGPKLPAMPSLAHEDTGEMAKPAGLTPPPPSKPPEPPKPKAEEKKKPEPAKKGGEKKGGGKPEAKAKEPSKAAGSRGTKPVAAPRAGKHTAAKPHAAPRAKKKR